MSQFINRIWQGHCVNKTKYYWPLLVLNVKNTSTQEQNNIILKFEEMANTLPRNITRFSQKIYFVTRANVASRYEKTELSTTEYSAK